jgi:hypothetical protein
MLLSNAALIYCSMLDSAGGQHVAACLHLMMTSRVPGVYTRLVILYSHVLCNMLQLLPGSKDAMTKFWVRPRPGDPWRDTLQKEQEEATSTYAELLATAVAAAGGSAATGGMAPGLGSSTGSAGSAVGGTLAGGGQVQLPGLGGAGVGIPGLQGKPGKHAYLSCLKCW